MSLITVNKLAAPIEVSVNGFSWKLTDMEARELHSKLATALSTRDGSVMEQLREMVTLRYGLRAGILRDATREADVSIARHIGMWLCCKSGCQQSAVARCFNRERSTVSFACSAVEARLERNPGFRVSLASVLHAAEKQCGIRFPEELKERVRT